MLPILRFLFGDNPSTAVTHKDVITVVNTLPKRYCFSLSQSGASNPVCIVKLNELGADPLWTRHSTGTYYCTLKGAFPLGKVYKTGGLLNKAGACWEISRVDSDTMKMVTYESIGGGVADSLLDNGVVYCDDNIIVVWP